ncbi:universal stress protein [Variovorax sp. H27-G14]|uniref:universal stress protein n=1 Tax=Variovorax sp. H27-G14 TaxID=3111914 RepID=UPI0038FCBE3D
MYRRILVPVDGSPTSNRGLDEAIKLARLTKGRLRLIHVIDELSMAWGMEAYSAYGGGDWIGVLRDNGALVVHNAKAVVDAADIEVDTVVYDSFSGVVHELVTQEAGKWSAELIVLGTHGRRGIGRLVLGSGAESILRYAPVPVLLVRAANEPVSQTAATVALTHPSVPAGMVAME